jgi:hypothetical protein
MLILSLGDESASSTTLIANALDNIYAIMEQGEGLVPGENTHCERFLTALDAFTQGGLSLLPLPRTPCAEGKKPDEAPVTTALTAPYPKLWAELFDVRYTMLLLDIGTALAEPRTSSDRSLLITWAFANMKPLLIQLILQLSSPALAAIEPSGPTFGLLYQDLPGDPIDRWRRYQALLQRESELISALRARPELANDFDGQDLLDQLGTNSISRSKVVAQKLANPS